MKIYLLFFILWVSIALAQDDSQYDHSNVRSASNTGRKVVRATEDKDYWFQDGQAELQRQLQAIPNVAQAKNIIFFLGDGTSIGTMTAARLLKGMRSGNFERESAEWDLFPYSGLIKTYSVDEQVTDSAASATAYLTGAKSNQETIGVDSNVMYGDCDAMNMPQFHTQSVLRDFQLVNKATGIVTTTRVTHASPAGNYAHTAKRQWENDFDMTFDNVDTDICDDIAEQLVFGETGANITVIMGGGRRELLPDTETDPEEFLRGTRLDGVNLIQEWIDQKQAIGTAEYVYNSSALFNVDLANTDYLLGLFEWSHMDYTVDNPTNNPTLSEMVAVALQMLQKNTEGYFLFVEGGLIDLAHHSGEYRSSLEEASEFENAITTAVNMTFDNETLIIVTADHAHSLTINGYSPRGSDILGLAETLADDDMGFTILNYGTGPGYRTQINGNRPNASDEDYTNPHYVAASAVPHNSAHHAGEDIGIFARGPHSQLFTGVHENSYIPHAMRYAACVGAGINFCGTRNDKN